MERIKYQKLPGRPHSFMGVRRLWQGPDHLLWVETLMGQEHYRRFYFEDIQSIILQRTRHHHYWSISWGILAFVFAIIALVVSGPPYVSGFLTSFFLVCLGINVMLGPTCIVYLQTAVQMQQVSLGRLTKALRAMDRLKILVEGKQGRLEVAPFALGASQPLSVPGSGQARRSEPGRGKDAPADQAGSDEPLNPIFHILLFSVLGAAGAGRALQFWVDWLSLGFLDLLLVAAGLALAGVALVRGHHQTKGLWLGYYTWAALIFSILHGLANYVCYIAVVIQNPDLSLNHWELLKRFVITLMGDHPAIVSIRVASATLGTALAGVGFLSLRRK